MKTRLRPAAPLLAAHVPTYRLLLLLGIGCLAACCGRQRPAQSAGPAASPAGVSAAPHLASPPAKTLTAIPHVTLVALSDWQGVIKPCGCTEELQRGGVERIAAWLKRVRSADDSVVVVHAGAALAEDEAPHKGQEAQRLERAKTFSAILRTIDIAAVALSSEDLKRPGVAKLIAAADWPVLSAGWRGGVSRVKAHRMVTTGSGVKVGIFALDPKAGALPQLKAIATDEVRALRGQGAEVVVLLSNLDMRSSRRVARAVAGIDAVVLGRVPPKTEPVEEGEQDGDAWMLMAPRHGAYMATLTLGLNGAAARGTAAQPWRDATPWLPGALARLDARIAALQADLKRYAGPDQSVGTRRALPFFKRQLRELQRARKITATAHGSPVPKGRVGGYASVGLPWSDPVDPTVAAMVKAYDSKVGAMNVKLASEPVPAEPGKARYVGEAVCRGCHMGQAKWADGDKHHQAWPTLVKVRKTQDLDCVPCHVTGWRAPGGSAFSNLKRFSGVQCEACHGPGSAHIASATKTGPKSGIVRRPTAATCGVCHTPEHSPRFSFRDYVPRLIRPGHGKPAGK